MMLRDALALKSAWWPMGIQVVLKRRFGRYRMESGHRAGIAKASRMTRKGETLKLPALGLHDRLLHSALEIPQLLDDQIIHERDSKPHQASLIQKPAGLHA